VNLTEDIFLHSAVILPTQPSVAEEEQKKDDNTLPEEQASLTIEDSIQRLQHYEGSVLQRSGGELYVKPDVNRSLFKHAERLGSKLMSAAAIMEEYNKLKAEIQ
jgi:hypothetical protein